MVNLLKELWLKHPVSRIVFLVYLAATLSFSSNIAPAASIGIVSLVVFSKLNINNLRAVSLILTFGCAGLMVNLGSEVVYKYGIGVTFALATVFVEKTYMEKYSVKCGS